MRVKFFMIFVGNSFDFEFLAATPVPVRCALGSRFFVLLFSDNSAVHAGSAHSTCFVVPVHYPSFVRSLTGPKAMSLDESVDRLFEFKTPEHRNRLAAYVASISDMRSETIKDLAPGSGKMRKKNKPLR